MVARRKRPLRLLRLRRLLPSKLLRLPSRPLLLPTPLLLRLTPLLLRLMPLLPRPLRPRPRSSKIFLLPTVEHAGRAVRVKPYRPPAVLFQGL